MHNTCHNLATTAPEKMSCGHALPAVFLVSCLLLQGATAQGFTLPLPPPSPLESPKSVQTASPAPFGPNVGFGPLALRGQSPFQLLRLSLIPTSVQQVPRGVWLLNATGTWTNRWAKKENKYLIDAEILRVAFSVAYGVADWLHLRMEIPFCTRSGGFMDSSIEQFHKMFSLGNAGREDSPRDRFRFILWRKDGTRYQLDESHTGTELEDVIFSSKFRLTPGGRTMPQTCLTLHLKIPTGDEDALFGSGSVDGGAALSLAKRVGRFYAYLAFQYTHFGGAELAGIPMRTEQYSILTALEYAWTNSVSLIVQELINTGAARDFYEFSKPTHEITFGLKGKVNPRTFFELGLIENLFRFDNTPDIGVHLGISHQL